MGDRPEAANRSNQDCGVRRSANGTVFLSEYARPKNGRAAEPAPGEIGLASNVHPVKALETWTTKAAAPWFFGVVAIAIVPITLLLLDGLGMGEPVDSLLMWVPVFWAGAIGGFVLELIKSRGTMELPSTVPQTKAADPAKPDDSGFGDPVGPRIDLGFLGRIATSALAAPVALILLNVPDDAAKVATTLAAVAPRVDTLSLAVAIGFAAPAVWAGLEAIVTARLKALQEKQANGASQIEQQADLLTKLSSASGSNFAQVEKTAIDQVVGSLRTTAKALRSG